MKSFIYICLLLLLASCNGQRATSRDRAWKLDNGRLKALSTIAMIDDLVSKIGGDYVDAIPLIRGELDPHSYELVKGDDEKFARADLIFFNGLGLEHGVTLRQNLEGNPKAISVSDPILKNEPERILIVDGQYDPHIWMDIALWMRIIDPIVEALSSKDPAHAEFYCANGKQLYAELARADAEAFCRLQALPPEKRYLVTSHDAFNYFTRHYLANLEEADWEARCEAPEGLAPDAQLSVTDIQAIITHVQACHVSVLFPESNVSRDALKKILSASREKGIALRLCEKPLFGDAMGESPSYLAMIQHNVDLIAEELAR